MTELNERWSTIFLEQEITAAMNEIEALRAELKQAHGSDRSDTLKYLSTARARLTGLNDARNAIALAFEKHAPKKPSEKEAIQVRTHNLTEMEQQILKAIPHDNFYEAGFESVLWTRILIHDAGIDERKSRGSLSSLVKKGYVCIEHDDGNDNEWSKSTIFLTDEGIEWLKTESGIEFTESGDLKR